MTISSYMIYPDVLAKIKPILWKLNQSTQKLLLSYTCTQILHPIAHKMLRYVAMISIVS